MKFKIHLSLWLLFVTALTLLFDFEEQFFTVYAVMALHETAHLLCALLFKIRPKLIKIMPFGIEIKFENEYKLKGKKEALIAISGPLFNLVLFFISMGLNNRFLSNLNLSLFIINMMPVLPLDGGRILKAVLYLKTDEVKSIKYTLTISRIFDVVLFFIGFYILFYTRFNFSVILIAAFLMFYIFDESQNYNLLLKKVVINCKEKFGNRESLPTKYISAKDTAPAHKLLKEFNYNNFCVINVLDKNLVIEGIVTESEVINCMMIKGSNVCVRDILKFSIASWNKVG